MLEVLKTVPEALEMGELKEPQGTYKERKIDEGI